MAQSNCIDPGSAEEEDGHPVQIMTTSCSGSNTDSGRDTVSTDQVKGGNVSSRLKGRQRGNEVGI